MGIAMENNLLTQAKKAQGETNQRLDALLVEQKRTNELLVIISQQLHALAEENS